MGVLAVESIHKTTHLIIGKKQNMIHCLNQNHI